MRFLLFIGLLLCCYNTTHTHAQSVVFGSVVNAKNKKPLAYVNIGVVGKDLGTVSDQEGAFRILFPQALEQDSIRFSMLGYKPRAFLVRDFINAHAHDGALVTLEPATYALKEVTVTDNRKVKILGTRTESHTVQGGFRSNQLGCEAGVLLKVKKSPSFVNGFYASITHNTYDTLFFRLNFYTLKDGLPDKNILPQNIFLATTVKSGLLHADLSPYNIVLEEDAVVTLEWLKELGGTKGLYFSASLLNGPIFYRQASQGKWQKERAAGLGFWVTVEQ